MKKLHICLLSVLVLFTRAPGRADEAQRVSERIGDTVITLLRIEDQANELSGSDHHRVTVQLRAENIGKQALCVSFKATIKTTFGLEYQAANYTPNPFRIRELLPAE